MKLILCQGTVGDNYRSNSRPKGFAKALTLDMDPSVRPDITFNLKSSGRVPKGLQFTANTVLCQAYF